MPPPTWFVRASVVIPMTLMVALTPLAVACVAFAGEVGHWSLDEGSGTTIHDSSPAGNNGTLSSSTIWSFPGYNGQGYCIELPGYSSTQYASISDSASLGFGNFLYLSAWVNPEYSANAYAPIFCKGSSNAAYALVIYNGMLRFQANYQNGGTFFEADSSPTVSYGQWSQVAVAYDQKNVTFYINGVKAGTTPQTTPIINNSQPLYVGIDYPGSTEKFKGRIDEIVISNSAPAPPQPGAYTPPAEKAVIQRLGKWNGTSFEPVTQGTITSGNVDVLVHGWEPGWKNWVEGQSGLALAWNAKDGSGTSPGASLEDMAKSIAYRDPNAVILAYTWIDDSATDPLSSTFAARESRRNTDVNGDRLATALFLACGMSSGQGPNLHLIGHSHGARVATVAAIDLQETGHAISHLTIMDSPDLKGVNWLAGANNLLDQELVKLIYGREIGKTFVDNYQSLLGGVYLDGGGGIVNVQLKPADGWLDPGASHGYPLIWYDKATMATTNDIGLSWSPLLGTQFLNLQDRYVQDWEFAPGLYDASRELVLRSEAGTIGPDFRKKGPLGYLSFLTQGDVVDQNSGKKLTEHSPAYWYSVFGKTDDDLAIQFDFQFLNPGDGDQLGIWIDDELRFILTGEFSGTDLRQSVIDIADLGLGDHVLTVALHSYGDANASVWVGDLMMITPEPTTLSLLALGGLAAMARRKGRK